MSHNIRIYISQFIALFVSFTTVSEILKVTLLFLSILFTAQKLYLGFLDVKDRKEKKKQLK